MTIWERIKRFIAKDDTSDYVEPPGIGVAWLWKLPDSHPFFDAANRHDAEYDLMARGESHYTSSVVPDLVFFQDCLRACAEQRTMLATEFYLSQAHLFYGLIRAWGVIRWKGKG